jgi:hypothetical protein
VLNLKIGSGKNVNTRVDQGENQGSGRAGTERLRDRQHLSTGGNLLPGSSECHEAAQNAMKLSFNGKFLIESAY